MGILAALLVWAPPAAAQHLQSPLVPAGRVRADFAPSYSAWDSRYGLRTEGGTTVEGEEPLGSDLTDPTGISLFPGLETLQESISALSGQSGFDPVLGEVRGHVTQNLTRLDFGLHVGVFDWLTVGASLPWVKNRTVVDVAYRPAAAATLGVSPSITANEDVSAYLQALADATAAATARADALCGGNGAACSAAQDLADRTEDFARRAGVMYTASPFFPFAGTAMGNALALASSSLSGELAAAGLGTLGSPAFATDGVTPEDFAGLPTSPSGGVLGSALESRDRLWAMGDLELSAAVRLLQGEVRDSGAAAPQLAWTVAGGGLVRLPTGKADDPDVFLEVAPGGGQMDVEGFAWASLRVGGWIGLVAEGRYGIQGSTNLIRRVAPPEVVLAPVSTRRAVSWSPASYLDVAASPRFHVTDALALAVDYRYYDKGSDTYELLGDEDPATAPDPAVLEVESGVRVQEVAVGLRYSTLPAWRRGESGSPLDLSFRVVRSVAGGGGQVPVTLRAEMSFRLFRRIWGAP